jgi:hypothetical protein
MILFIHTSSENPEPALLHLKKYIIDAHIEEIESVEITASTPQPGEMGGGIINSLTAVLIGAANPFSRLVESFSKYASSFRTEIIIRNEFGDELVLNTKRLDKEGINYLVDKFLDKTKASHEKKVKKETPKAQKKATAKN